VAKDGTYSGAHRIRCPDGHQEQRLARRRVAVPIGSAHQPAERLVISLNLQNIIVIIVI